MEKQNKEQNKEQLNIERNIKQNDVEKQSRRKIKKKPQNQKLDKEVRRGEESVAYTYIVECGDGTFYTGWTNHLEERMKCHNEGKGAKYTRSRLPVRLIHYEIFASRQDAMKREYAIKQLTRKDKLQLIAQQPQEVKERCKEIALKVSALRKAR